MANIFQIPNGGIQVLVGGLSRQISLIFPNNRLTPLMWTQIQSPITPTTIPSTYIVTLPQDCPGRAFTWNDIQVIRVTAMYLSTESGGISVHAHFFTNSNQLRIGPIRDQAEQAIADQGMDLGHWSCQYNGVPLTIAAISPRGQQRPRARKPRNSFIIYRQSKHMEVSAAHPDMTNGDISKFIAALWKDESNEVKKDFTKQAQEEKEAHAAQNPGWKCKPRRSSEIKRRNKKESARQTNGPTLDRSWMDSTENHLTRVAGEIDTIYQEAQSIHEETFLDVNRYMNAIAADNDCINTSNESPDVFGNVYNGISTIGRYVMYD